MTAPTPESVAAVNAALASAVADSDQNAAVTALAGHELVLPQTQPESPDSEGQRRITLPVVEQDGAGYVPAFTSVEQLAQSLPDTPATVVVDASELAGVWPSNDLTLLVNPGDAATSVAVPASAMPALASGGHPM